MGWCKEVRHRKGKGRLLAWFEWAVQSFSVQALSILSTVANSNRAELSSTGEGASKVDMCMF